MGTKDDCWDVNKYRLHYEMDHQWELKKKFLLAHKDKFDEDRLISLAQTFCNIHFLGCRYSDQLMDFISKLSEGISTKSEKWSRQSFVAASSAVEDKVKARLGTTEQQPPARGPVQFIQGKNLDSTHPSNKSDFDEGKRSKEYWVRGEKRPSNDSGQFPKRGRSDAHNTNYETNYSLERKRMNFDIRNIVNSGPFGKLVVFQHALSKEENPVGVVERTASAAHMITSYDFTAQNDEFACKLSLDGLYLATGHGRTQKTSKEAACKVAIERLKETSFTIVVKASYISSESVERNLGKNNRGNTESSSADIPIADSNIGSKMLKLMGWSGGGLGKNEQGIEEPIKPYDYNVRRGGLGISNFSDFKRKIVRIIEDFAHGNSKEDLVFSPEFSKEERKVIHELVRKYNLKSRSFGKEEETRRLVVFKKIRPLEIVEDLMCCGGETEKYKLIPPLSTNNG